MFDLVGVFAPLETECDVRGRSQTEIPVAVDVEIAGPFAGQELAVVEVRRRGVRIDEERTVARIDRIDFVVVAAIGGAEIRVPPPQGALDAESLLEVGLVDIFQRVGIRPKRKWDLPEPVAAGHAKNGRGNESYPERDSSRSLAQSAFRTFRSCTHADRAGGRNRRCIRRSTSHSGGSPLM